MMRAPPTLRSAVPQAAHPAVRGFTILEIMIATGILTLGLVSILALFPYAIDQGRRVMETSTAVTIARSVADQIRAGIRNKKRLVYSQGEPYAYFIFEHDGVMDPIPKSKNQEKASGDYYILLPRFPRDRRLEGGEGRTEEDRDLSRRQQFVTQSREFLYPEADEPRNGGGDPNRAHNDGDDYLNGRIVVKKTYRAGTFLPDPENPNSRIPEDRILEDQKNDQLKQYSFAFSIRGSLFDTNLSQNPKTFQPGNNCFHVHIMVFRAFNYNEAKVLQEQKGPSPVYEMDFEVEL